jgi:dihydroneopterin aldolase / 2-amino-4-hydroxy-6-hydroxymethyldihydropteridine diphosphokinase
MDIIEIDNLRLRTQIGFSAHELDEVQDIVISLRLGTNRIQAGETDNPVDAFNYKTVTKAIIKHVENASYFLIEKLAEEIARLCIIEHHAPYVEVRIHKPGALRHADSVGLRIERRPEDYQKTVIYVSLGSNIYPEENLIKAVQLLRNKTTVLAVSPVYRTAPQGYIDQPYFLNMAVKIHTYRTPLEFKTQVIDSIESELKRVRDPNNKNAPRTIDLDISLWNNEKIEYGDKPWIIPDPDITRYAHVNIPLSDLAPNYTLPTNGKRLSEIANTLDKEDMEEVKPIDFI